MGNLRLRMGHHGLGRALVIAGVENQVMSLWPVSDTATRDLMIEYYKLLQTGEGRGDVLRRVQLEMMRSKTRAHPYYWAAFIPSGDWRKIEFEKPPSMN
jgi:CHAT domain-containing protein